MAALAACPTGAMAEVYSCEIKEWVRVNDEGLVRPAPSAPFKRQVSIDKETGNAVGDALSAANRWEVVQKRFARKRVRDSWARRVAAPL